MPYDTETPHDSSGYLYAQFKPTFHDMWEVIDDVLCLLCFFPIYGKTRIRTIRVPEVPRFCVSLSNIIEF